MQQGAKAKPVTETVPSRPSTTPSIRPPSFTSPTMQPTGIGGHAAMRGGVPSRRRYNKGAASRVSVGAGPLGEDVRSVAAAALEHG